MRGRVADQHAHGFPMETRAVEKVQNAWYSSGTFKKTDLGKKASTHMKEKDCCTGPIHKIQEDCRTS